MGGGGVNSSGRIHCLLVKSQQHEQEDTPGVKLERVQKRLIDNPRARPRSLRARWGPACKERRQARMWSTRETLAIVIESRDVAGVDKYAEVPTD